MVCARSGQLGLILILTVVHAASPDRASATPDRLSQAILDGKAAELDIFGATVALVNAEDDTLFCSGTLVTPEVVLTAAHCLVELELGGVGVKDVRAPEGVEVVAHVRDLSRASPANTYEVRAIVPHPEFTGALPSDPGFRLGGVHDLGVVILSRPIEDIDPTPLLAIDDIDAALKEGAEVLIAGFGATDPQGEIGRGELRMAAVSVVELGADELIAGSIGTADTCAGDSGGSLYVRRRGSLFLAGTTSRAVVQAAGRCGQGGVYTLSPRYREFVGDADMDAAAPNEPSGCSLASRSTQRGPWPMACSILALRAARAAARRRPRAD